MRQAQQNRRGRGRNRKGQNPLTRTYESNGPDVKIRGTPAHIAEKYVSMARDALSSGDPVLAENYLQHAEHYNRIIMSHREQQMGDDGRPSSGNPRPRMGFDPLDDDGDDMEPASSEKPMARGQEPQPSVTQGGEGGEDESRGNQRERGHGRQRERDDDDQPRANAGGATGGGNGRGNGRRRPRYAENDDQPEFLKRPVRRRASNDEAGDGASDGSVEADQAAE